MLGTAARRSNILRLLRVQQRVRVSRLAQQLGVSTVTIRNDLRCMSAAGLLTRQHGGARLLGGAVPEAPLAEKRVRYRERKQQIAALAASLIRQDDKIILDAGSTTLMLSRVLPPIEPLTVFTNSLAIVNELAERPGIHLIMSGGALRRSAQAFQGPQAEASLQQLFFDKLFLGADGCSAEFGVSTHDSEDARLNSRMLEHAQQVILLADSSKFQQLCLHRICAVERLHSVISDPGLPAEVRSALTARGVQVLITEESEQY